MKLSMSAGARQHHGPYPVVVTDLVEQLVEAALENGIPGVVPVRAVERERGHAVVGDVEQHGTGLVFNRIGHRAHLFLAGSWLLVIQALLIKTG